VERRYIKVAMAKNGTAARRLRDDLTILAKFIHQEMNERLWRKKKYLQATLNDILIPDSKTNAKFAVGRATC
jgi:hypothetical protein